MRICQAIPFITFFMLATPAARAQTEPAKPKETLSTASSGASQPTSRPSPVPQPSSSPTNPPAANSPNETATADPLPRDLDAKFELFRQGDFSLKMGGLLHFQGAFYTGDQLSRRFGDPVDTTGFRMRRVRLSFSGQLVGDFSYYIALDLKDVIGASTGHGDLGNEVLDARVLWSRYHWLQIAAGVDRVPFSAYMLQSSTRLLAIERPVSVDLLAPNRRLGLSVMGSLGTLTYALGFYNGSEGVTSGNQLAGLAAVGRLTFSLFPQEASFMPRRFQATLGGAFMYDDQAAVEMLRASGSLALSGFRSRLLVEFLWQKSTPKDQPTATPDAGEVNSWASIAELGVFVWRDMLELFSRYEYFKDNDQLPTFGEQQLVTLGLNLYLHHERLKVQLNYQRRDELEGAEVQNDLAFVQLQAMF